MKRIDIYETKPRGMNNYLANYGWHFSKSMCEHAVSNMKDRNGTKVKMSDLKDLEERLKANGIKVDNKGYDIVYLEAMAKADYIGGCMTNEAQVYKFISDTLCDKDGYDGMPFTRYYADCLAKGDVIIWEDLM